MKIKISKGCYSMNVTIDNVNISKSEDDGYEIKSEYFDFIINTLKTFTFSKGQVNVLMDILHGRSNKFDLSDEEYEALDDEDEVDIMCDRIGYDSDIIIEEIINTKNQFDINDISELVRLIIDKSEKEEDSTRTSHRCDQCGDHNYTQTFFVKLNL